MSPVLDSRVIRIIRWLLDQEEAQPTSALAADLGLSQRVVRYRLGAAEAYLASQGATLTRRRGAGLQLKADAATRTRIRDELAEAPPAPRVYAPDERMRLVLAHLLWSAPDSTSLDRLQQVLEVSKASARRDLHRAEPWLERRGLPLTRKPGIGISLAGTELAIRQATVQLILEAVPEDVLVDLCRGGYAASTIARVKLPAGLREQLATLPLQASFRLVEQSPIAWTVAHGNSELVFAIYLAVTAARLADGKTIAMDTGQQRSLMDHPLNDIARKVALQFGDMRETKLSDPEVAGITGYLLGLATLAATPVEETRLDELLDRLLAIAGAELHPTLAEDGELRRGLRQHLERLAVRLRYGLPVHNPLLREVADRYPEVFEAAELLGEAIAEHLGEPLAVDEIGFITMYLSGAMERSRLTPLRRALVVCPAGMATAWVLVSRVQAEFPQLEIAGVVGARGFEERSKSDIDLVISTVPLDNATVPVVVVSPLVTLDDVRRIADNV